MHHDEARALFRAHAAARLRGDEAEARRLADRLGPAEEAAHLLFTLHLMTAAVFEEFGSRPDPGDLAELTERLHDAHYREGGAFNAIRAEAMVRACCGEGRLAAEIPFDEQPGYMWAVITELVDPGITDAELAERFAMAEALAETGFGEAFVRLWPGVPVPNDAVAPQGERASEETGAAAPAAPTPRGGRVLEELEVAVSAAPSAPQGEPVPEEPGAAASAAAPAPQGERMADEPGSTASAAVPAILDGRAAEEPESAASAVLSERRSDDVARESGVAASTASLARGDRLSAASGSTAAPGSVFTEEGTGGAVHDREAEPPGSIEPSGPARPAEPVAPAEPAEPAPSAAPAEPAAPDRVLEGTAPSRSKGEPTP